MDGQADRRVRPPAARQAAALPVRWGLGMNWNWELLMAIATYVIVGALVVFFGLTLAIWMTI
jgi:hypothetical protein